MRAKLRIVVDTATEFLALDGPFLAGGLAFYFLLFIASVAGAVLLEISKWLFAWQVSEAKDYAVFYGALGGLVLVVLWIYCASMAFVLGATLGTVLDRGHISIERDVPSCRPRS